MTAPFGPLTPDFILTAVEASGLRCDGRLLTLNSYENRVYQVGIEDAAPLIAKFYRPGRWSDAAILEEHAFLAELAEAEIPAVPALEIDGKTLHEHEGFRIALFERRGGRAPELDDPEVLTWLGRFLGRIHAGMKSVHVYLKGPGAGREPAIRALAATGMRVLSLKDITPVPYNGCRPPKRRRF